VDGAYECSDAGEWDTGGKFRDLTEEEWRAIRQNESPWKNEELALDQKMRLDEHGK
jgi:hypothetical protein